MSRNYYYQEELLVATIFLQKCVRIFEYLGSRSASLAEALSRHLWSDRLFLAVIR
ncbi:MAG: hypothetical protein KatS3mg114_0747 [Planctomycetaceae bacterium]|nr:MAG: hypothetical protein KatS3mg114_0747 [Planctomycetaceae bacterium]